MTDRAARMITETLFLGDHSDLPTTTVTSIADAVATIRSGRRALTSSPDAAVEILVALGLDEPTAQRRVTLATGATPDPTSPPQDAEDGQDSALIPRPPTAVGSSSTEDLEPVEPIDALQLMVAVLKVPGLAAHLVGGGVQISAGDGTPAVLLTAEQVEGWTHRPGPDGEPTIEVRIRDQGAGAAPGRLVLARGRVTFEPDHDERPPSTSTTSTPPTAP